MLLYKIDSNILPKVAFLSHEELIPPVLHKTRTINDNIIYFIIDGGLCLSSGGEELTLRAGDMHFFRSGEHQKPLKSTYCKYYYIHLDKDYGEEISFDEAELIKHLAMIRNQFINSNPYSYKTYDLNNLLIPKDFHFTSNQDFNYIIELMKYGSLSTGKSHLEFYKTISSVKVLESLIETYRSFVFSKIRSLPAAKSRSAVMVKKVVNYLCENYQNHISSKDIELVTGYSFDYINKKIKDELGTTIFAYLNNIRINNVKVLIKTTSKSIKQIADETGFRDEYYFSSYFKKKVGVSPTDYAKGRLDKKQ